MKFDFDRDIKRTKRRKFYFKIVRWIIEVVAVILLAYVIINFTMEKTSMLGDSMQTTLTNQDKIIINKLAYLFKEPKRFDVIVFKQSGKEHSYYNIKRVIGLPGETIQIINGSIYINDEQLKEPMITDPIKLSGLAAEPLTLDEDEYFVLGDNRNNSEDSRFANIGNVVKDEIIGKAWIRISPFDFINKINMYAKTDDNDETTESSDDEE